MTSTPARRRSALALVAGVLIVSAATQLGRLVRHPRVVGANHQVNPTGPIDAYNSPSLARNPHRGANVALTYRKDRPDFSAVLESSSDGGATWHPTPLPLPTGLDRPFAPDVAFGPDGTLYVTYVNLVGAGNSPGGLWLAHSSDGGRSLSSPVQVAGRLAFQARLAVGADGTIYVTWLQASEVGLNRLVGAPNPIVVSRSRDGGHSFSAPVIVSDRGRPRVGVASPVVDSAGRLFVLYEDFKDDRRDFEYLEGPPAENPFALVVTSSGDGGQSFSAGVEVNSGLVPSQRFLVFLPEFPSLALGPLGQLYVAWADGRYGDDDVFISRSSDRGRVWTGATRVNDNRLRDGTSQSLPRVAVAPSGRVDVVFYDRRRDPRHDVMTDAYLATSVDGGRTFANLRVSSQPFDSRIGPSVGSSIPTDLGSRLGLIADNHSSLAAWTDTRLGNQDTGRQDIWAAAVSSRASSAAGWAVFVVLAVLAVLAILAAVGTGGLGGRRRRSGASGPSVSAPRASPPSGLAAATGPAANPETDK